MRNLRASKDFAIFLQIVQDIAEFHGDILLNADTDAKMHEQRGYILGLKGIVGLVDIIIQNADQQENERRITETGREKLDPRNFTGSAWYDTVWGLSKGRTDA